MIEIEQNLDSYLDIIRKTRQWAVNNWPRILEEPDIQGHYKAPCFWAAVGDMKMAGRHRKLFAERFLQPDGDFRMEKHNKGFLGFPCTVVNQYIYSNGWIIRGMQKLGAYDLAARGLEFILRFQDDTHGGFYLAFDPLTGFINKSMMDSSSTSSAGMALLDCGRIKEARAAGDFILRLFSLQPEPDNYFFSCMKADGTLFTDVFASENQWDPDSRKQKCLSAAADGNNELTWLIGKPTKFLTRLYTATGEKKYLDGAIRAFRFFHKLDKGVWTNYASCKTMWAGAELFRITGEQEFAGTTLRILNFYRDTQTPSGTWVHTLWYKSEDEQSFCWTADITYEYGAEISDVLFDLSSRLG
jgi:hypothetical protein